MESFPGLRQTHFQVTSQPTLIYNCIAWAAGDTDRFWWPGDFWPADVPRKVTRKSFVRAFEDLGYSVCKCSSLEAGFEKVAFYEHGGKPTHAARQLLNGLWTSKLGTWYDISHLLEGLSGKHYGKPAVFMRRPIAHSTS